MAFRNRREGDSFRQTLSLTDSERWIPDGFSCNRLRFHSHSEPGSLFLLALYSHTNPQQNGTLFAFVHIRLAQKNSLEKGNEKLFLKWRVLFAKKLKCDLLFAEDLPMKRICIYTKTDLQTFYFTMNFINNIEI